MKAIRKILLLFIAITALLLTACNSEKTIIDYGDEAAFEAALNNGENLEGKTVQFTAIEFHPESAFGYNIWAGEHLNFVSARHPNVEAGDTLVVRVTTIEKVLRSWIIQYEKVENATIGQSTIFSDSTATADSMAGTYVGKNGSVLILREDGTTAYYYMNSDEIEDDPDNTWDYADSTLKWMYNGNEITASIDDNDTFTLAVDKEKEFEVWIREEYFKVSDDDSNKTVSECRQLLRDTFDRAEIDNFNLETCQPYPVGGVTFQIPFYWLNGLGAIDFLAEFMAEYYYANDAYAGLTFSSISQKVSNETFESIAKELWNVVIENRFDDAFNITKEPVVNQVNGYSSVRGQCTAEIYDLPVTWDLTMINIPDSEVIAVIEWESEQTIFQYDSDLEKIINSITSNNTSSGGKSDSSYKIPTKNTSDGVTPELKEFLDSYEDFMDDYVAFMKKYQNSSDSTAMLMDYLDFIQKYGEFMEKADAYDTDEMSAEDAAYYLEVTSRIAQKLLNAAS